MLKGYRELKISLVRSKKFWDNLWRSIIPPLRLTLTKVSPRFTTSRRQGLVKLHRICSRVMQYPNKSLLPRRWSSSSWDRRARKFSQNVTDLNRLSWLGSHSNRSCFTLERNLKSDWTIRVNPNPSPLHKLRLISEWVTHLGLSRYGSKDGK